jgi:putative oxidoreductase
MLARNSEEAFMANFMRPFEAQTYAALRIVSGFLFVCHGVQKVFGMPYDEHIAAAPGFIIWIAGPIELMGGLLVMIGLYTRWAAFLCSGLMAFAYWIAHGLTGGFAKPLPLQNGGELAVAYCFVFLFISARGPGIWALDKSR